MLSLISVFLADLYFYRYLYLDKWSLSIAELQPSIFITLDNNSRALPLLLIDFRGLHSTYFPSSYPSLWTYSSGNFTFCNGCHWNSSSPTCCLHFCMNPPPLHILYFTWDGGAFLVLIVSNATTVLCRCFTHITLTPNFTPTPPLIIIPVNITIPTQSINIFLIHILLDSWPHNCHVPHWSLSHTSIEKGLSIQKITVFFVKARNRVPHQKSLLVSDIHLSRNTKYLFICLIFKDIITLYLRSHLLLRNT